MSEQDYYGTKRVTAWPAPPDDRRVSQTLAQAFGAFSDGVIGESAALGLIVREGDKIWSHPTCHRQYVIDHLREAEKLGRGQEFYENFVVPEWPREDVSGRKVPA